MRGATASPARRIVLLGLSVTSSWGNGHATTYRALMRELSRRGHEVTFLERDVPWYAANRDLPEPPYGRTRLYGSLEELRDRFARTVAEADFVLVGSYVPDGIAVGDWVLGIARGATAFYDIDTPVTLAALARGACDYLSPELLRRWDLYLSFTGGPVLQHLERRLGARAARALYCSVDAETYRPMPAAERRWLLGYMGTWSADRQEPLETLLCRVAASLGDRRFVVAGPQYPAEISWPANVERLEHVAPPDHPAFYAAQEFTLNLTRADMKRAGWSPSVRLFEAAACGVPIVSDAWPGLESFFRPGREILVARDTAECRAILEQVPEAQRRRIGDAARRRVLDLHTSAHRAAELEAFIGEAIGRRAAA